MNKKFDLKNVIILEACHLVSDIQTLNQNPIVQVNFIRRENYWESSVWISK